MKVVATIMAVLMIVPICVVLILIMSSTGITVGKPSDTPSVSAPPFAGDVAVEDAVPGPSGNRRTDALGNVLRMRSHKGFDVDGYLERYGYLVTVRALSSKSATKGAKSTGDTTHDEQERRFAIRKFQQFAQLPQTGVVDEQTIIKMQQPRCGVLDTAGSFHDPSRPLQFNAGGKWLKDVVTWKVAVFSDKLPVEQQRIAIVNSFRHWGEASRLRLEETEGDADIVLNFTSGNHGDGEYNAFDGPGGVLAHAFLPPNGAAHFDNEENWVFHEPVGAELETIVTHEIGHSLGLLHSTVRGSVMVPFYREYSRNFSIHIDDVAGLQYLYGRNEPAVVGTFSATSATTTSPIANTTSPTSAMTSTLSVTSLAVTDVPSRDQQKIVDKLCFQRISAASTDKDRNTLLFIGQHVYKFYEHCIGHASCLVSGYPRLITAEYEHGPSKVSAALYIPDHRKRTYLLKGRKLWRYTGSKLDLGYPRQMNKSDLPYMPTASFLHKNQFADYQWYIFGGQYFWELRLDSETLAGEVMKTRVYWDKMPTMPDAIVQTRDGSIYVFKKNVYNKYDHRRVLLEKRKSLYEDFLGAKCLNQARSQRKQRRRNN